MPTFMQQFVKTKSGRRAYQQEKAILDLTELVCSIMNKRRISRPAMAKRLKWTKRRLDGFLDGRGSLALWMCADVFTALRLELQFSVTGFTTA